MRGSFLIVCTDVLSCSDSPNEEAAQSQVRRASAERTRQVREFHDTLLQTIQGSKIIADVALDEPADSARMRRALVRVSGWLAQAMQEGRAALNSLRTSTIQRNDLAEDLQRAGEYCPINRCVEFRLSVAGTAKEMHPIVRDEVYRIGYEAIRKCFPPFGGQQSEREVELWTRPFFASSRRCKAMDPEVAAAGRGGHFGLQGMRERAARIGSRFSLTSSATSGTKIVLVVPGNIVFATRDRFGTSCSRR